MQFNFNWNFISDGAPYVTVSKTALAFNTASAALLGNPEEVIAGFDEDQKIIGIKAFNGEKGVKPYKFYSRIKNGWIRIGCKDFVNYLSEITGEKFSPAKRYVANYDKSSNILYIKILDDQNPQER